jgi:hypothetical protein
VTAVAGKAGKTPYYIISDPTRFMILLIYHLKNCFDRCNLTLLNLINLTLSSCKYPKTSSSRQQIVMTEPVTVFGAVTAASALAGQVIQTIIFISDFYSNVQDAPEWIHKQDVHVEQLINVARLIIQNPSVQTDSVASILETCLRESGKLREVLQKSLVIPKDGKIRKFQKCLMAGIKEKEIIKLFENLEREKSSLMLCIQESNA